MAIAASGAVSLQDFRTEFVGGSAAISLGDLYRGGSNIRANAANNSSTNLAASVPASGVIDFQDFHGTAKGFRKTYTSGATNQNASSVFGDDYGVNYPKEIVINSGVELGATGTGEEALQINSGLSGTMTITNNGTLSGAGGAAGGGAGGDAFEANVACILINNGTIRAGGGGGGNGGGGGSGGTGGQGRTSYTYLGSSSYAFGGFYNYTVPSSHAGSRLTFYTGQDADNSDPSFSVKLNGTTIASGRTTGGVVYTANNIQTGQVWRLGGSGTKAVYRSPLLTGYNYYNGGGGGSGGAGGGGGRGQGYNHAKANGSGGSGGAYGSGGGTNAGSGGRGGTGGTGGNGGTYGNSGGGGASGATGNSGGNGNYTNGSGGSGGSSGSGGGAAGKYIRGLSNVTFTNNGTVQGGTA